MRRLARSLAALLLLVPTLALADGRSYTTPEGWAVTRSWVVGRTNFRAVGYNGDIGTTLEDVTEYSNNVPQPTVALAMQIDGASAADTGSISFSGTATDGSNTTLVDTSKDFTGGGTPVIAGDYVLNDTLMRFGVVTTVAATVLTFSNGYTDGDGQPGNAYRVLDVSAGGTNVQLVEVDGLNNDYAEQSEFVVTNGIGVQTLVRPYLRVNGFHAMYVGVPGNVTAGTILLEDQATGLVTHGQITAGGNMMLQAYYTVPADKTMYITDWTVGSTGNKAARAFLRITADLDRRALIPDTFLFQDVVSVQDSTNQSIFTLPIKAPGKADVKVSAISTAVGAAVATSFGFWLESNP